MVGTEVKGKHQALMHIVFFKEAHSRFLKIISLKCEQLKRDS